jgi:hypothetical protein
MHRLAICGALLLAGCGAPPAVPTQPEAPPPPLPTSPELSPALQPLAWMLGDWEGTHGTEHWVAAGGALYGVGFGKDGSFDVMIVDDAEGPGKPDGILRFLASPNGSTQVEFRRREDKPRAILFANPAHDFPKTIAYRADGERLAARIAGDGDKHVDFAFRRGRRTPAPELDAADQDFSTDTGTRGVDGWLAAFHPQGGMLKKGKRIEGHAAIGDHMRPLLSSGKLAWAPIANGKVGSIGFTVGKATFVGAKPEDNWKSTYITIWKQTEGGWKVLFDTGRVVNE